MVFWLLFLLFGLSRLYHLTVMPPFLDELIYVRWLNQIKLTGDWLIPLKEFGWEPLQIWLAACINRLGIDPLLSLRLTASFFSAVVMVLVYRLGGKSAALLYVFSPLILLHDRLGMRGDQAVMLAGVMVYYGLKRRQSWWWGLGIGLGLLAKTTAAALPAVVVLSYLWLKRRPKPADFYALVLAVLPMGFYLLTGTIAAVLNKQNTFIGLSAQAGDFLWKNNLLQIGPWLWQYLTWPVLLLVLLGIVISIKNRLLLVSWLVPLVLLVFSAKILFPRYLLPIMPFIAILAAAGLNWLKQALPRTLRPLLTVFLLAPVWFSWRILTDITAAPLPEIDNWQYVSGWPSGYGVKELTDYWQENQFSAEEILTDKAIGGGYAVTNIDHEKVSGELIKEFPRPGNKSSLKLWQLE